jgi:hypothetical protein
MAKLASDLVLFSPETPTLDRECGEYRPEQNDEDGRIGDEEAGFVDEEDGEERDGQKGADEGCEDEGDLLDAEFLVERIQPVV